jgi:hypothetical protein
MYENALQRVKYTHVAALEAVANASSWNILGKQLCSDNMQLLAKCNMHSPYESVAGSEVNNRV